MLTDPDRFPAMHGNDSSGELIKLRNGAVNGTEFRAEGQLRVDLFYCRGR